MGERASGTTSHMQAMGVLETARIMSVDSLQILTQLTVRCRSWHLSITFAYLPAYIVMALMWKASVFTRTNAGVLLIINLLTAYDPISVQMPPLLTSATSAFHSHLGRCLLLHPSANLLN
jgi:ATP-binding cassette subfamily A (ABC1) protein 3